ncbi:hypothetical protein CSW58_10040 [Caulobacter sp. B11]|uniref:S49 family peptidase n=1 Tax=Caulobacter sp. B11 TaxID=2048899 RepID=UPI000C129DD0|nr:S49 family peptidase [Caulobacter sp. B11]PHY12831.1 hypothetical protein CSW58_10040 [Caulobacter sp. B11]
MRNPALLAAELSGRPLLMRDASVLPYAQMLGVAVTGERRSGLAAFIGGARRLFAAKDQAAEPVSSPMAYAPVWMGEPDAVGLGWVLKGGVGVIEISGPLMEEGFGWGDCWYHGYDTLLLAFEEMAADARVLGVMARIKSNGGIAAPGLPQLAAFLRGMRASAGGKPIWAYCAAAYSAAYWIAAQFDQVVAPREGGVGSIGAVISHCDISEGLKADGVKVTKFTFGAKKTDGAFDEPLSETAIADFTADVQQCGRWFVADVIAGRPSLSAETVIATQAGCYFGDSDNPAISALGIGLIDAVMTERQAFDALSAQVAGRASPALSPTSGQNVPGAQSSRKEIDMKRSQVLAGLKKAGLNRDQIRKAMAELPEDAPEAEGEGEDDAEDDAEDAPQAEGEGEGEAEDAEPEADKVSAATAKAVLDLPEAKGREKLAKKLAFTPGMSVKTAQGLLSAAGKETSLADRMQGRDPNLTSGGGQVEAGLKARLSPDTIYARRAKSAKRAA